jgi:RNA 3'-terminal phosphate cyclase
MASMVIGGISVGTALILLLRTCSAWREMSAFGGQREPSDASGSGACANVRHDTASLNTSCCIDLRLAYEAATQRRIESN